MFKCCIQRNNKHIYPHLPKTYQNDKSKALEEARAKACTEENLKPYFERLKTSIERLRVTRENIYNVDEKGLYPTYNPPPVRMMGYMSYCLLLP